MLGKLVDVLLVRGLIAFEHLVPMPARLGAQLPVGRGAPRTADPVVLVPGFANAAQGWDEWKRSLEADGFQVFVLEPPTFGLGDMEASAEAVAAFIADVKRRTGRSRVDVVGFSEGGLLARMAIARLGSRGSVDRLVTLASPHRGLAWNGVHSLLKALPLVGGAVPAALTQMVSGSDLLRRIEREDRDLRTHPGASTGAAGEPRYTSIFSRTIDSVVTPMSSWLPGVLNVPVASDRGRGAGPTHFSMFHTSDRAYEAARALLLDQPDQAAVDAARGAATAQG